MKPVPANLKMLSANMLQIPFIVCSYISTVGEKQAMGNVRVFAILAGNPWS